MFEADTEGNFLNRITEKTIGCAIEVHKGLGLGLLEFAYEECLCYEFSRINLKFERQVALPVIYKGVKLDCGYRMDIVVESSVILEIKAVSNLIPVHEAQSFVVSETLQQKSRLADKFSRSDFKTGFKAYRQQF